MTVTNPGPFSEWVQRHARGTLNDEATAALADVVKAVSDVKKPGKVVIEVIVEPAGSSGRTVAIGGRVTKKAPVPAPELGVFYVGDNGSLHRDDPFQARLEDARQVEAPPVRTVETTEEAGDDD